MGIPKNAPAENKDAAWTVITYLTSKEWERYQTLKYQTDPTRNSTFFSPAMNKALPYLATAGKVFQKARILEIANIPETFELITIAAAGVRGGADRHGDAHGRPARRPTTSGSPCSSAEVT